MTQTEARAADGQSATNLQEPSPTVLGKLNRKFWRNYRLEACVIGSVVVYIFMIALIYKLEHVPEKDVGAATTMASLISAAVIFIIGQIYSRQKEIRESRRARALALFFEWHSKDMRDSRRYVSHYRDLVGIEKSLRNIEKAATEAYGRRRSSGSSDYRQERNELRDPEKMEQHFFAIYQFFERWYLLLKNNDIEQADADIYMSSYKDWYIDEFIKHWEAIEKDDPHIRASLRGIIEYVARSDGVK